MNEIDRSEILNALNKKQRDFLNKYIVQKKRDIWIEKLAYFKGITIDNNMDIKQISNKLNDWVLVDILDGGEGVRRYNCYCGRPLRYQYILEHTNKHATIKLGVECLKKYTNLDEKVIRDIKNGIYKVNNELDDILIRYKNNVFINQKKWLKEKILPEEFLQQLQLGLPLSQKQENKVTRLLAEEKKLKIKKRKREFCEKMEKVLSEDQKDFINNFLNEEERFEVLIKFKNGDSIYSLEDIDKIKVSDILERQVTLGLPLTDKDKEKVEFKLKYFSYNCEQVLHQKERKPIQKEIKLHKEIKVQNEELLIDYETLIQNHATLLKQISAKKANIPLGLFKDWEKIRKLVWKAKDGEKISRREFLLMLSQIANCLGIYDDVYKYYV